MSNHNPRTWNSIEVIVVPSMYKVMCNIQCHVICQSQNLMKGQPLSVPLIVKLISWLTTEHLAYTLRQLQFHVCTSLAPRPMTVERDYVQRTAAGDFRIWTRFLRKYVYSRVIWLDFNPWPTADLVQLQAIDDGKLGGVLERGWLTRTAIVKSFVSLRIVNLNFLITLANKTFIFWWW